MGTATRQLGEDDPKPENKVVVRSSAGKSGEGDTRGLTARKISGDATDTARRMGEGPTEPQTIE